MGVYINVVSNCDLVLCIVFRSSRVIKEDGCVGFVDDELFIVSIRVDEDDGGGFVGNR